MPDYTPLQEEFGRRSPYRVLTISMMLNLTHRRQVRRVLEAGFFDRWPTAFTLARADREEIAGFIAALGLQRQRATRLIQLARALTATGGPLTASDVPLLPGCGVYAQEAYRIFVDRDTSFTPQDKVLREHVNG